MSRPPGLEEPSPDLLRRAGAGDHDAFTQLVHRYYRQIHRWALSLSGDPDEADDAVQETLVRLYDRLGSFAGRARFSTWLYQVTRNTALGLRRRRLRRRAVAERVLARQPGPEASEGRRLEALHRADLVAIVRTLFAELPTQQREVFDLVDFQGHPPADVARLLGMNPNTVRAHLFKARRTIRRRILATHPEAMEEGV